MSAFRLVIEDISSREPEISSMDAPCSDENCTSAWPADEIRPALAARREAPFSMTSIVRSTGRLIFFQVRTLTAARIIKK